MTKDVDPNEKARQQLCRLAESMADDILGMSDEEFLAELREAGEDLDDLARRGEAAIAKGIAESGRRKLAAAREGYRAAASTEGTSNIVNLSLERKREILSRIAANNSELRQKLTMAARHEEKGEIPENDVDSFLEDLQDLGAIDEEGNPT